MIIQRQKKSDQNANDELNPKNFITTIDFQSQNLLSDTITELIHNPEDENDLTNLKDLHLYTREDPKRVIYPSIFQFPFLRAVNLAVLIQGYEISDGVFTLCYTTGIGESPTIQKRGMHTPTSGRCNVSQFLHNQPLK